VSTALASEYRDLTLRVACRRNVASFPLDRRVTWLSSFTLACELLSEQSIYARHYARARSNWTASKNGIHFKFQSRRCLLELFIIAVSAVYVPELVLSILFWTHMYRILPHLTASHLRNVLSILYPPSAFIRVLSKFAFCPRSITVFRTRLFRTRHGGISGKRKKSSINSEFSKQLHDAAALPTAKSSAVSIAHEVGQLSHYYLLHGLSYTPLILRWSQDKPLHGDDQWPNRTRCSRAHESLSLIKECTRLSELRRELHSIFAQPSLCPLPQALRRHLCGPIC
jgi:hypothetical protein